MATKTDQPGLLSRMALFVHQSDQGLGRTGSAAARPRTVVTRQTGAQGHDRAQAPERLHPQARIDQLQQLQPRCHGSASWHASVFQYGHRIRMVAVTLKQKIDEIEAQMLRQWWKGNRRPAAASAAGKRMPCQRARPVPACPDAHVPVLSDEMPGGRCCGLRPHRTIQIALGRRFRHGHAEFAPTEMGDGMPPLPAKRQGKSGKAQTVAVCPNPWAHWAALRQWMSTGFHLKLFALDVEDVTTDPELEEADHPFCQWR